MIFPPSPKSQSRFRWLCRGLLVLELAVLIVLACMARRSSFGAPAYETTQFQPSPDMPEQVFQAWALAHGHSLLIPVGHELHPSRYSPFHPFFLSLWMRIHRGDLQSIFSYSPVALFAGLFLLWLTLLRWHWPAPARILAVVIILFSQLFFDTARHVLQEPTLWLLFTLSLVLYPWASQPTNAERHSSERTRALCLITLFLSAITAATLLAIRPTLAPWPLLLFFHALTFTPLKFHWPRPLTFSLGLALPIALALIVGWRQFGHLALTGYHYWVPDMYAGRIFSLQNLIAHPVNRTGHSLFYFNFQAFFGHSTEITTLGPCACWLAFIGFLALLIRQLHAANRARSFAPIFSDLPTLLALFAASQFLIHNLYEFQAARFFILAWPAFILAGITGWMRLITFARTRLTRLLPPLWYALQCGLVILALGLNPFAWTQLMALQQPTPSESRQGPAIQHSQARAAHRLANFTGPVAVLDLATLNARLILSLVGSPAPIIPLFGPPRPDWDPHLAPDMGQRLPTPSTRLAPWDWPAWQDGLWAADESLLIDRQLEALKQWPGGFAIYYPLWKESTATPILKALKKANWRLEDATTEDQSRLFFAKPPKS